MQGKGLAVPWSACPFATEPATIATIAINNRNCRTRLWPGSNGGADVRGHVRQSEDRRSARRVDARHGVQRGSDSAIVRHFYYCAARVRVSTYVTSPPAL